MRTLALTFAAVAALGFDFTQNHGAMTTGTLRLVQTGLRTFGLH